MLALPQEVQSRMADALCKTRCPSAAYNRYLLSKAWTEASETPAAVCNLAYMARYAPRRFRKSWQGVYDQRARMLRQRWGLPPPPPASPWFRHGLRRWLAGTCVAPGAGDSPHAVR